jgi:hypothetical protein
MSALLYPLHLADTVTGWVRTSHLSRNRISVQNVVPTEEMLAYASLATLGDDVYFDQSTAFVHHIIIFFFLIFPILEH